LRNEAPRGLRNGQVSRWFVFGFQKAKRNNGRVNRAARNQVTFAGSRLMRKALPAAPVQRIVIPPRIVTRINLGKQRARATRKRQ
jgi:hypothetical protein